MDHRNRWPLARQNFESARIYVVPKDNAGGTPNAAWILSKIGIIRAAQRPIELRPAF
jgi:hypothetical protein